MVLRERLCASRGGGSEDCAGVAKVGDGEGDEVRGVEGERERGVEGVEEGDGRDGASFARGGIIEDSVVGLLRQTIRRGGRGEERKRNTPPETRERTSRRGPFRGGRCARREAPGIGSTGLPYIVEGTLQALDTCPPLWGYPRPRFPRRACEGSLADTWTPAARHACATAGISSDLFPSPPACHSPVVHPKERHLALPIY